MKRNQLKLVRRASRVAMDADQWRQSMEAWMDTQRQAKFDLGKYTQRFVRPWYISSLR